MSGLKVKSIARTVDGIAWWTASLALAVLCYWGYYEGTYFSQDDYVWLCFAKFDREPQLLLFRNSLAGQFFRPLGQYWWVAVHSVAGNCVSAFQCAVLATHFVNAVLASWLAARIAGPGVRRIVFLLYALSPIFVAPVSNYFHYNFDTLGCAFFLMSLLLVSVVSRGGSRLCGLLSIPAALGAYFSKEAYFTLPAVALLVAGISSPGARWEMGAVRRSTVWLMAHAVTCAAAWGWRWTVIGRFGGYGLTEIRTLSDLVAHVIDRINTLTGFAGWSVAPFCQRWSGAETMPLIGSVALLGWLTWRSRRSPDGPGPLWCWSWIVIAWTPSIIMTTYAAVSFYPALPGSLLLLTQVIRGCRSAPAIALAIAAYFAAHGWFYFADRAPFMAELKRQHEALQAQFPPAVWQADAISQLILLDANHDLFPDAAVKYSADPGTSLSGLLMFNINAPVNWVVTDADGPGDIRPLVISKSFHDGFMAMPPYRAYPLEVSPKPRRADDGRPLRLLLWDDTRFRDGS